ncbi:hypothetical protein AB0N05_37530 [Nocardia sp. NPDC051030]|uniref:hypothetical protein n=1 Tax=Nocardia sp. NPDC051030 TaxID=3155162 RepID=UPI0034166BBE
MTITAQLTDLADITPPAIKALAAFDISTVPCETLTRQRLLVEIRWANTWVCLEYASFGTTTLKLITPGDLTGHISVWDALEVDPGIGTTIAASAEWLAYGDDRFARWLTDLEITSIDPEALQMTLAALATMRTQEDILPPAALCVLQLQDALSNLYAGTGWVTVNEGEPIINSRTLIEALTASDYLDEHDEAATELILRIYRTGRFEDAEAHLSIVHSSQFTATTTS